MNAAAVAAALAFGATAPVAGSQAQSVQPAAHSLHAHAHAAPASAAGDAYGYRLAAKAASSHAAPSASPDKLAATQAALRDLWIGHIFWVRDVVQGLVHKDAAAAKAAEQQAVANAQQIAAAIEPFYGKSASEGLFKLLAGHYGAVKAHAEATIAGDTVRTKQALDDLTANAGQIAVFLSGANPYLPEATLRGLLISHGGHHVQQNQQLAAHDLAGEARTWEAMKSHMYTIADALGGALAKQFPDKF